MHEPGGLLFCPIWQKASPISRLTLGLPEFVRLWPQGSFWAAAQMIWLPLAIRPHTAAASAVSQA